MNLENNQLWHQGIAYFNQGDYWDCHEVLEKLWLESEGINHSLLAGVILLAAALHKARNMGSQRGGRRNYAKALKHLALVPDHYADADIRELEAAVHLALRKPEIRPRFPLISSNS